MVALDLVLYAALPDHLKTVGLAAGHASSFVVGLVVCSTVLARRTGGGSGARVVRTAVRCLVAVAAPALLALLVAELTARTLGQGPLGALVRRHGGGAVLGAGYLVVARRLRVPEVDEVLAPVLRRVRR